MQAHDTWEADVGTFGQWEVGRDADRPLAFTGALIGEGANRDGGYGPYDRMVLVRVWKTAGGAYVWARWHRRLDEGTLRHRQEAGAVRGPVELLAALRDNDGALRFAEHHAWAQACAGDSALKPYAAEVIE